MNILNRILYAWRCLISRRIVLVEIQVDDDLKKDVYALWSTCGDEETENALDQVAQAMRRDRELQPTTAQTN